MITFSTGIPSHIPIVIEGIGLATLQRFTEDGHVFVYVGGGRVMKLSMDYKWQYAKR